MLASDDLHNDGGPGSKIGWAILRRSLIWKPFFFSSHTGVWTDT